MPPSFTNYLRLEGVNLDAFVGDTRQLSVNRGGSLLLLQAVKDVEERFKNELTTISQGASIGLFGIASDDPAKIAQNVRESLSTGALRHGTFVVDVVEAGKDFRPAAEAALAGNRWQQMQASSLSIPEVNTEHARSAKEAVCGVGLMRPASKLCTGIENKLLSPSVHARFSYGREKRQYFYEEVTGITGLSEFVKEFHDLASGTAKLNGKMAVFYADGNRFGSLQTSLCPDPARQALWDHAIREKRREFLTSFLRDEVRACSSEETKNPWLNDDKQIRFETLLWGGDELMFVMPAELGWRFATCFFKHFGKWDISTAKLPTDSPWFDAKPSFPSQILTHSAALIFAQHHAPIDRLKQLAKEQMTEFAKNIKEGQEEIGRKSDNLMYLALESFDHLGSSFEHAMSRRYGGQVPLKSLVLGGGAALADLLQALSTHMETLRDSGQDFARSQLHELVSTLIHPSKAAAPPADIAAAMKEYFFRAKEESRDAIQTLASHFSADPNAIWIHLEELWDYTLP